MHRESGPAEARHEVLDVGPDFYAWARTQGLEAGPWPDEGQPQGQGGQLLSPEDGDEYLLEAGVPLLRPVHSRPRPSARRGGASRAPGRRTAGCGPSPRPLPDDFQPGRAGTG